MLVLVIYFFFNSTILFQFCHKLSIHHSILSTFLSPNHQKFHFFHSHPSLHCFIRDVAKLGF